MIKKSEIPFLIFLFSYSSRQQRDELFKVIKTFSILFLFFLSFQPQTFAQRFKAGVTAGLTATDISGADTRDYDNDFNKVGYLAGGYVSTALSDQSSVQMEINYILKGASQQPDSFGNGYYKFSYNYLEIPVLYKFRIHFNVGGKVVDRFDLHAGLSFGRMVQYAQEGQNLTSTVNLNYINQTDYSILGGAGYYITSHFNFSFRYSNSINPVIKGNTGAPVSGVYTFNKGHNLVLHFYFQYTFGAEK